MSCVVQTTSTLVTAATMAPLSVQDAKMHLKAISDHEDLLVESWIAAATQYFEEQTGRPILSQTWEYWLDAFPLESVIEIPHPPLREVESVTYMSDGEVVTLSDGSPTTALWRASTPAGDYAKRGWIESISGTWPTADTRRDAVRIRYTAGYAESQSAVPSLVRAALLLLVGQFDQFRAELHVSQGARIERLPMGLDQMIAAFKTTALSTQVLHR